MVLINVVDDLGDDLVLQGLSTQVAMVFVIRKPLLMQRHSYRIHLRAHPGQVPLGRGEHGIGSFMSAGAEREGEDFRVGRWSGTPSDGMWSVRQIVFEPRGVAVERRPGGLDAASYRPRSGEPA